MVNIGSRFFSTGSQCFSLGGASPNAILQLMQKTKLFSESVLAGPICLLNFNLLIKAELSGIKISIISLSVRSTGKICCSRRQLLFAEAIKKPHVGGLNFLIFTLPCLPNLFGFLPNFKFSSVLNSQLINGSDAANFFFYISQLHKFKWKASHPYKPVLFS